MWAQEYVMALNIKQVYESAAEALEFDLDIPEDRLAEIKRYSLKDFHISGGVYNRSGIVSLNYRAVFILDAECDRCLGPIEKKFDCRFKHLLLRSSDSDDDEYIVTCGDILELEDIAVQDALLQLPAKLLCREDCKGLCIVCGADLNLGDCGCGSR